MQYRVMTAGDTVSHFDSFALLLTPVKYCDFLGQHCLRPYVLCNRCHIFYYQCEESTDYSV